MQLPNSLGGARRRIFYRLIANGVVQATAMVASALLVQRVVDSYIVSTSSDSPAAIQTLWVYTLGLVLLGLLAAALRMGERVDAEQLGQSYAYSVRRRLFDQLARLTPRAMASRRHGDTMLRFVGDLSAMRRWLSMGLARLASAGLLIVITFVVLAVLNWPLALTVFTALGMALLLTLLIGPSLEIAIRELRRLRTFLADNIAEKTSAMIVVQSHGQIEHERRRLRQQNLRIRRASVNRAIYVGALRAVSEVSIRVSIALALLIGAYQVAAGNATPGTVVAAMSIVAFLAAPVRDLSRVYDYWHAARVSREKLQNFLADPRIVHERRRPKKMVQGPGQLEYRDVSVEGVFAKVNAIAQAGELVVLTGPNGSGKSTLIWMAARLLDPATGSVLIDGQDVSKLAHDELRQNIGIVSSDIPLLKGSIDKNIRYRHPRVSAAELDEICALCDIDSMLDELPGGRRTKLSAGGRNLSQGQRQRVALARALVGSPRLLLLDEPDIGLDQVAQDTLRRVLDAHTGTVLMVSHDPRWMSQADSVWQLADRRLSVSPGGRSPANRDPQSEFGAHLPRLVVGGGDRVG